MSPQTPKVILLLSLGLLTASATGAGARTWIVREDGTGDAPTIGAAIAAATAGDVIEVQAGMYYESLDFQGKDLHVKGAGPEVTQVSAAGLGTSVVRFQSGESRAAILEGLTLTGGMGTLLGDIRYGGGVDILDSEPTLRGNRILGNQLLTGESYGGGIACRTSMGGSPRSPLLENNTLEENSAATGGGAIAILGLSAPEVRDNLLSRNEADRGGAIWFSGAGSLPQIERNRIEKNLAGAVGGGIYGEGASGGVEITLNLLASNVARGAQDDGGGAIYLTGSSASIRENTLVENRVHGPSQEWGGSLVIRDGGAVLVEKNILAYSPSGGGIRCAGSAATIRDNLLWANAGDEAAGDCADWWQADGNLMADPELCGFDQGDYRPSNGSPALVHPAGPLGAYPDPGCGPTLVEATTWGALKARY